VDPGQKGSKSHLGIKLGIASHRDIGQLIGSYKKEF